MGNVKFTFPFSDLTPCSLLFVECLVVHRVACTELTGPISIPRHVNLNVTRKVRRRPLCAACGVGVAVVVGCMV
jgi:hypothetical protein